MFAVQTPARPAKPSDTIAMRDVSLITPQARRNGGGIVSILFTKKDLAELTGYTYRRLFDIDKGLLKDEKLFVESEGGKCDLALFVQRWVAYRLNAERGDEDSLEDVKAIHEKVKTQKTELEVAKMRGELVAVQDVRRLWGDVANTVMQAFTALPSRIAPQILMMTNTEAIAAAIDAEVRAVLTQIAETPVPDYAMQEDFEPDDTSEF
jgi:phage terminase Nu1 subunit (DNA packaging protein)